MDSVLAEVYGTIDEIKARNRLGGFILIDISIIRMRLYQAKYWIQSKFFNKYFLEKAGERAYQYMLDNTNMEEEEEDE